jgi:hypothetical protein
MARVPRGWNSSIGRACRGILASLLRPDPQGHGSSHSFRVASGPPWLPGLAQVARVAELSAPPGARVLEGNFPPVCETKHSLHDDNPSLLPMGQFPADGQEDRFPLKRAHRRPPPSSTHPPRRSEEVTAAGQGGHHEPGGRSMGHPCSTTGRSQCRSDGGAVRAVKARTTGMATAAVRGTSN